MWKSHGTRIHVPHMNMYAARCNNVWLIIQTCVTRLNWCAMSQSCHAYSRHAQNWIFQNHCRRRCGFVKMRSDWVVREEACHMSPVWMCAACYNDVWLIIQTRVTRVNWCDGWVVSYLYTRHVTHVNICVMWTCCTHVSHNTSHVTHTQICDMTLSYVWHDSSTFVSWLIRLCDMTHSYVRHDLFIRVTWLIHTCGTSLITCV